MNTNSSSLEDLLVLTNLEIIGTQVRFSEIVWKYEGGKWNDAQRTASNLIRTGSAINYLNEIRQKLGIEEKQLKQSNQQEEKNEPVKTINEVQPVEKRNSENGIFEENYRLLNEFAPELEEELQRLAENGILSGKSATNIHGSTSIKSIEKDKYGYFLSLDINESSKPIQSILLYVNTTAKTVHVLSVESSDWKFEVYNDIHTRELVNLEQQEIQNKYFNIHLKKLIEFKLSIPTIDIIPLEEPKQEEQNTIEFQFPRRGLNSPNQILDSEREWTPYNEDEEDDIDYDEDDEPDFDDLLQENKVLREENEELKQDSEFVLNSVFPTLYSQSFKLLRVLIPDLSDEMERGLHSFTAYFKSQKPNTPSFKIEFRQVPSCIICDIFELDENGNTEDVECEFIIRDKTHAHFVFSSETFLTLKKNMHAGDHKEVSQIGLQANSALHNFFLTLLFHKYQSTIGDRVYLAETIENTPTDVQEVESVEESDGTGVVVAVLATIGLGILGFKWLK